MWGQQLRCGESDVLHEFLQEVFHPRLSAALQLAAKGDSTGFGIHAHRYNARRALRSLLDDVIAWRKTSAARLPQSNPSGGSSGACVTDLIISLAAAKVLFLMGQLCFDCMETLDGYRHVDVARGHLEAMQLTGRPISLAALEGIPAELAARGAQHAAGKPVCLSDPEKARQRIALCGTGILMETYVVLAVAWSRWGDADSAVRYLQAHELLKRLWDHRQADRAAAEKQRKVNRLLEEAAASRDALVSRFDSDADAQRAQIQRRLEERRARKAAAGGSNSSSSVDASPTLQPPLSSTVENARKPETGNHGDKPETAEEGEKSESAVAAAAVAAVPAMPWAHAPAFEGDVLHALLTSGLEGRDAVDMLTSRAATCSAQVLKSQQSMIQSSFYCHTSLAERVKALFTSADPAATKDWVAACMGLAEWFLLVMDLSHAEHCLAAIAEVCRRAKSVLALDVLASDETLRTAFHFQSASLAYLTLKLVQGTIASYNAPFEVAFAPMFLNPVLLPEELRNVPDSKLPSEPNWSFPERIPFAIPGLRPPRKELPVVRSDAASDAVALFATMQTNLDAIRTEIGVDVDCERFLESTRMEADALGVLFELARDPVFLKRRLGVIRRIYDVGLNANAFRNVLRQADYDCGVSAAQLADISSTASGEGGAAGQIYREAALGHFADFTSGFHHEIRLAAEQGKGAGDVLDPSDFPALLLGEMHAASTLLKLGRRSEAVARYEFIVRFFAHEHAKAMGRYPEMQPQVAQCGEMLALLQGGQGGDGKGGKGSVSATKSGGALPPAGAHRDPLQQRAPISAVTPSSRVVLKHTAKK